MKNSWVRNLLAHLIDGLLSLGVHLFIFALTLPGSLSLYFPFWCGLIVVHLAIQFTTAAIGFHRPGIAIVHGLIRTKQSFSQRIMSTLRRYSLELIFLITCGTVNHLTTERELVLFEIFKESGESEFGKILVTDPTYTSLLNLSFLMNVFVLSLPLPVLFTFILSRKGESLHDIFESIGQDKTVPESPETALRGTSTRY